MTDTSLAIEAFLMGASGMLIALYLARNWPRSKRQLPYFRNSGTVAASILEPEGQAPA